MLLVQLLLSAALSGAGLGVPVRVEYDVPDGWTLEMLESCEDWSVLSSDPSGFVIVPLALDTLGLPWITATNGSDTLAVAPPVVVVARTMPDSVYDASPFPAPLWMDIPPGFPEDYLERLAFWQTWGAGPGGFPWIPVAAAVLLASVVAFLLGRRRRRAPASSAGAEAVPSSFADRVLSLLDSPHLASGDYRSLYRELDALLRWLVSSRSGLDVGAMTHSQIRKALSSRGGFEDLLSGSSGLVREISLQRYAGWGSTREKAQADIRTLASLGGGPG